MRRITARIVLVTLAVGGGFGLWAIRVHTQNKMWPVVTHHPRVLSLVAVVFAYAILGIATIVGSACALVALWAEAFD